MLQDFLNPQQTIESLDFLLDNMIACDFGCGPGGWVIPLSKVLKNGRVYAVDILEEPLSVLRSKLDADRILNVEIIQADIEKGVNRIHNDSLDFIVLSNLLFQVNDRERVLQEAKQKLKNGGRMLIIDWKKMAMLGPKEHAISRDEMKTLAQKNILELEKEFDLGNYHWALIYRK